MATIPGHRRLRFGKAHTQPSPPRIPGGLRHRLPTVASLVFLATVIAVGTGVLLFVSDTQQATWQMRQREAASNAARTVNSFLTGVQEYMTVVGKLDLDYLQTDDEILESILSENDAIIELARFNKEGNVEAAACQCQGDSPLLTNFFTISQATWFQAARDGNSYVSDIQIAASNEPYLILAEPTLNGGVVAARLRMTVLGQVVSAIEIGETGQAYVVNDRGDIVSYADPAVVIARTTVQERPEMQSAQNAPNGQWYGEYQNFAGQKVNGFASPIPDSSWWLFVEVAHRETTAVIRRAAITISGGLIVLVLILEGFTQTAMDRFILTPLDDLRTGVERVGQGDFNHRLKSVRDDEIGRVATTFNIMTARLQEREATLAQTRDEALAASRFKSRMLANVSHDLRTPLNGILGYTEMLQEGIYGPLDEGQAHAIDRILSNTRRLLNMINELLSQAQIEAGKVELTYEPFDPASLLVDIDNILRLLAEQKGLTLEMHVAQDLPSPIVGDTHRLHQILMNLVGNAIKFTDQGRITVELHRYDTTHWCMEVTDTGRGIPVQAQTIIFDSFQQGDSSTTRQEGGIGLGLSIVQQLTTMMRGEVKLTSTVGQGSTFSIILPLLEPETIGKTAAESTK